MSAVGIGLVGVGGYGRRHLASIGAAEELGLCRLNAAVILPGLEKEAESELRDRGVRIYRSHRQMLDSEGAGAGGVDLVGVPCGIPEHAHLSIAALESGRHVLCEKPAAGCLADARRMLDVATKAGKILSIGFQNMYTPSIRRIKELALQGRSGGGMGKLLGARVAAVWPRDTAYYGRNAWAGRLTVGGVEVNDSPVQNALAHELQNLLYVAGADPVSSATPVTLYGEQYRAKDIESADTQYLRVHTSEGPVLAFMATHSCRMSWGPVATYVFEHGRVTWDGAARGRTAIAPREGPEVVLDNGPDDIFRLPYVRLLEALRDGRTPGATIHNCIQHCVCVDALFRLCPIVTIASEHIHTERGETVVASVPGIEDLVARMYDRDTSFYEAGADWARKGVEAAV